METRSYKEIINDLRSFSSENNQLSAEDKTQLNKYVDEIDSKSKDSKFAIFLLIIFLFGCTVMWFLNSIENDDLKTDNRNKKALIESYEKIIRFDDDSTHSFIYITRDGEPITYQELMDENFELLNKNSSLKHDIKVRDRYLELIKKQYGITVIEQDNKVWLEGAKIDSALLLLNLYRDKIKYNPQTKVWSVGR